MNKQLLTLLMLSIASLGYAEGPGRPSTPPVTDQELTKLQAFFRVQNPEQIIVSIAQQNILGTGYAGQTKLIIQDKNAYNLLFNKVENTKIILNTASIPNANKKIAINSLRTYITQLYESLK